MREFNLKAASKALAKTIVEICDSGYITNQDDRKLMGYIEAIAKDTLAYLEAEKYRCTPPL